MELPSSITEILQNNSQQDSWRMRLDFFITSVLGWSFWVLSFRVDNLIVFIFLFSFATILLFRALFFMHEFSHAETPVWFSIIWNVLVGFPLLTPIESILHSHALHHRANSYGSVSDPEYLSENFMNRIGWIVFLLLGFVIPIFQLIRYLILLPLCLVAKDFELYMVKNFSTLTINPKFRKIEPSVAILESYSKMHRQFFIFFTITFLLFYLFHVPLFAIVSWYFLLVSIAVLNQFRVSIVHNYKNLGQKSLTMVSQVQDSVNINDCWHTLIWAPLNSNFHALHHLAPQIPYFRLPQVHKYLASSDEFSKFYLSLDASLTTQIKKRWTSIADSRVD